MEIVEQARAYFASAVIPQSQGEYPSRWYFENDIEGDRLYVADDNGKIMGVYCYDTRPDSNYDQIFEGSFRSEEPYAAIHRIAVAAEAKGKGIAGRMVDHAAALARKQGFSFMRGDTHRLNLSMQRMMEKNGFKHCGIIYLCGKRDAENERFAFDKKLF